MYHWYKWQSEHLGLPETLPITHQYGQEFTACNLFDETQCFRDWISAGHCQGIEVPSLSCEEYAQDIARDYGLPYKQVKEWHEDPLYDRLSNVAGKCVEVSVPPILLQRFKKLVGDKLGIIWDTAFYYFSIQRPGDMFPLHRDRFKSADFAAKTAAELADVPIEQELVRYLILIEDQKPGQVFVMGNQPVSWRAGDAIVWPHHHFEYHGSANFGYWPKYTLRITAQKSQHDQR